MILITCAMNLGAWWVWKTCRQFHIATRIFERKKYYSSTRISFTSIILL